jgi:large subunit ribosomal protein L25
MAEITLAAQTGRPSGSRPSNRARATGQVPGVVYGHGGDPVPVLVDWRQLRLALTTDAGLNALINLEIDGSRELTIVKELQRHPVRRDVVHVDFLRISRDEAITVDVPIVLTGEAEQVLKNDGVIEQVLHALTVTAKPGDIPDELSIDISAMEVGHTVRVSDLSLPSGVSTDLDDEEPVVTARQVQLEVPEEPEAEAAEGEEAGEGAEGEAGAESASGGAQQGAEPAPDGE